MLDWMKLEWVDEARAADWCLLAAHRSTYVGVARLRPKTLPRSVKAWWPVADFPDWIKCRHVGQVIPPSANGSDNNKSSKVFWQYDVDRPIFDRSFADFPHLTKSFLVALKDICFYMLSVFELTIVSYRISIETLFVKLTRFQLNRKLLRKGNYRRCREIVMKRVSFRYY